MFQLTQQSDIFHPAETFLNALPFLLADRVAAVPRGSLVDGAAARSLLILRYMRGNVHMSAFGDELSGVKALITAHRKALIAGQLLQHQQCRVALGAPVGLQQLRVHNQTVAILYQQIAAVTQLRLLACSLARQLRIPIGGGLMRLVGTRLPVKIHRWIAWILRGVLLAILGPKTL